MKVRLRLAYSCILMVGIVVAEFLLLAPIYPYQFPVVDTEIILPQNSFKDCESLVWLANVPLGSAGWATVDVRSDLSFGPDPLRVVIEDPFGPEFLNQTGTEIKAVLPVEWLNEGYLVTVENPGVACDGSAVRARGRVEFYHEETRWRGLLFE